MINPRTNKKYENQIIQGRLDEIDKKINANRKIKRHKIHPNWNNKVKLH